MADMTGSPNVSISDQLTFKFGQRNESQLTFVTTPIDGTKSYNPIEASYLIGRYKITNNSWIYVWGADFKSLSGGAYGF